MKTKALTTLLLSAVCLLGLMGGTSSARSGLIDVNRQITLNIQRLGASQARYFGGVSFSRATIARVATAKTGGKKSGAAAADEKSGVKKAPKKKRNRAMLLAEQFCVSVTRTIARDGLNPVQVTHLSTPPFLIGQAVPSGPRDELLDYTVTGNAAPAGDRVQAFQQGGIDELITGPFEWSVDCKDAVVTVTMP